MRFEDLVSKGILQTHDSTRQEINNLLTMAKRRLSEANNLTISNETRLVQAYHVILACATIALRAKGYRARTRDGKHYHSIETLQITLKKPKDEIRYYHNLRKRRHEDMYEGMIEVSNIELEKSIDSAERLFSEIQLWLESNFPDLLE